MELKAEVYPELDRQWHSEEPREVLLALKAVPEGLSETERRARLQLHGPNQLLAPYRA